MKLAFTAFQGAGREITLASSSSCALAPHLPVWRDVAVSPTPSQLNTADGSWQKRGSHVSAPEGLRRLCLQVPPAGENAPPTGPGPFWPSHSPSEIGNQQQCGSLGATWPDNKEKRTAVDSSLLWGRDKPGTTNFSFSSHFTSPLLIRVNSANAWFDSRKGAT